jgi:osmotically-inducible protein OsmY
VRPHPGCAALLALALAGCTGSARQGAEPAPTRAVTAGLKDALIQSAIKAALAEDVGALRVRVHVEDGIATLAGTTPDAKSKAGALAAARQTAGVRNVVDRIRVAGP